MEITSYGCYNGAEMSTFCATFQNYECIKGTFVIVKDHYVSWDSMCLWVNLEWDSDCYVTQLTSDRRCGFNP